MKINFIDLDRQYKAYKNEIDAQMNEVISTTSFIMGKKISELEAQAAKFVGAKHAISCSSGTDALLLALIAYDTQPGDEIITTPFSFIAVAEVVAFLKAKPVFVDIDTDTYNINSQAIPLVITERTRGIIAVNLFGQCAEYDEINQLAKKHNLFVIEDAAQSFGATYKNRQSCSLADIGCTSFFPAKPLGCFGDGGMIFTNDDEKAAIIKSIRIHGGGQNKYDNIRIGINARLDTLQAAVLLAKLKHFPEEIKKRNEAASYYNNNLSKQISTPIIKGHNLSVFAQYVIRVERRDELKNFLKENDIPTAIHYPKTLHLQEAFSYLGYKPGDFPIAEGMCDKVLALPMHPFIERAEQDFIIDKTNSFYHMYSN